jgi:2-methylisocitrate lyase-like PEP mutase family enzyme
MLEAVARICAAVSVPVSADAEAGYGDAAEDAARTAAGVLQAGAVGMNLEDGTGRTDEPLVEVALQVEKILAVVDAGRRHGVPIVLNSRTDVYLRGVGPEKGRLDEAIRRGKAYRDAGADCIFVPGVTSLSIANPVK